MANKAVALLLASHPGPTLVVTAVTTVLGVGLGYPPGRLVVLAVLELRGSCDTDSRSRSLGSRCRALGCSGNTESGFVPLPPIRMRMYG